MQNRRRNATFLVLSFGLSLLPLHAHANGLIGTSVTGGLFFNGGATNYFSPANGYVPSSGYENSAGATVTIASPAVEFGAQFPTNTDLANFSATQFTLEDVVSASGSNDASLTMTFTDTAFAGEAISQVSDSFPNGGLTVSLSGDTITAHWAGGAVNPNDDYTSTVVLAAVPEPATWAAAGVGAGALALAMRRKRRVPA